VNLAEDVANDALDGVTKRLNGGSAIIFDASGNELASCSFSAKAFTEAKQAIAKAFPLTVGVAIADGVPTSFEAFDPNGQIILAGTAGYKDNIPKPEMRFKVRRIVQDADVSIDAFEISIKNLIKVGDPSAPKAI